MPLDKEQSLDVVMLLQWPAWPL